jgi:antitoxin ParD1/3/4
MGAEKPISVTLSEDNASLVRDALETGDFASPEQVIAEAMALWKRQRDMQIAKLREMVEEGIASGFEPWEGAEALKKKFRERMAKRAG